MHATPHTSHASHAMAYLEASGVVFHHPTKRENNWTNLQTSEGRVRAPAAAVAAVAAVAAK